jgi:integrase
MPKHKSITELVAKKLRPPKKGQADHFDSSLPGLVLRVAAGGRKSWCHFYRTPGGKLRRQTLGIYPAMTVKAAHEAWITNRDLLHAGRDPARTAAAGATHFKGVAEEWLKRDQAGKRTHDVTKRALEREVYDHWGHRDIDKIGRRDCLDLIDGIADRGHVIMARRIHGHLHRLFRWSVGRGIIEISPMQDLPKPGAEKSRDRVHSDAELVQIWNALDDGYGQALRLLILTGARREEIAKLRWSEIVDGNIELKGERTKNGEARIIPLSAAAMSLIEQIERNGDLVFGKLSDWSGAKKKIDAKVNIPHWVIHDLRRSVATQLQKLGVSLQTVEAVLGHTAGSRAGVVGIYQRHDFADEKRAALQAWGARVISIVGGGKAAKVLPLTRRGRR